MRLLLLLAVVSSPFVLLPLGILLLRLVWPGLFPALFFMNWKRSLVPDYSNLTALGVKSRGRNLYVAGRAGRIGAWHLLPLPLVDKYETEQLERSLADENYPVVLYAHGNAMDRTSSHRIHLYNVLTANGFHVITFDYRGYGDSEGTPTEEGLLEDARTVHDYVRSLLGANQLFIWGHSMGTGVSVQLVRELCGQSRPPAGLVLESGFNNLRDVIIHHPMALPFRYLLPSYLVDQLIVSPFRASGISMQSDCHIRHISCPILVLHAANDAIIPVELGRRLYETGRLAGLQISYVEFEASRQLGHKDVSTAEELPMELKKFTSSCR